MKRIHTTIALTTLTFGLAACGGATKARAPGPDQPTSAAPEGLVGGAHERDVMAEETGEALAGASMAPSDDAPAPPPAKAPPREREARSSTSSRSGSGDALVRPSRSVKAGEWDDNANFREFRRYLSGESHLGFERVDMSVRRFVVVQDAAGKGVPGCTITVRDETQHTVSLQTTSSGRALLFPRAEGLRGDTLRASASCREGRVNQRFSLEDDDGVVAMKLAATRTLPQRPVLDLAFVLDTTGSMGEEIKAVKETIRKVAGMLGDLEVDVRIGLVEYRDNSDSYVTRVHAMSSDVGAFARRVDGLSAGGGGDTPENANRGLSVALKQLQWSQGSVARLAFLIADAPPHLDYQDETSYAASMREANHRGIQIYTIAASGMDPLGQAVWRQIAHYTGGTNMFVLRGGAGPQSTGGGDPKSSCGGRQKNYASGNLAGLIGGKLALAVASLDADPLMIAGLGQDERAKPCEDRIVLAH